MRLITTIMESPIAVELKEALLNCDFAHNQIFAPTTDELALILEIDQLLANLIREAAKQR
jgi:hypothetical protein